MLNTNETAGVIVNKVFDESQKVVNMNITSMNNIGIAAVLTGLTAFFVAGYRNDFDLAEELTPAYQKKIMTSVSKEEYDNYTYILNNSYVQFREAGIKLQYRSDDWAIKMMAEFAEMLLVMLRANATDYSRGLMLDETQKLLYLARNTGNENSIVKPESNNNSTKTQEDVKKGKKIIIMGIICAFCVVGTLIVLGLYRKNMPFASSYVKLNAYLDSAKTSNGIISVDSNIYSVKEGERIIIPVKWPDSSVESYMGFSDSSVITAEWVDNDAVISGLKPGVSELYFGSDQECSIDRFSVVVVCYD